MVKYSQIIQTTFNLSPSSLQKTLFKNSNKIKLKTLLNRDLKKQDNGVEIGSSYYISKSDYFFGIL